MKPKSCEIEIRILEALGKGVEPEALEEPLRRHIEGCASCAEMVSVYELFQTESKELCAAAPIPGAGRVWWRASLAARRATAERALRPILIAERAALAVGCGVLLALLILVAPWLSKHVEHSSVFAGTMVYSVSLSSLIVASLIVCLLLVAGALYTLWAEK